MDPHATRRDRLRPCLAAEGIDALLLTNPISVTYLTGFTGDSSLLALTASKAVPVPLAEKWLC